MAPKIGFAEPRAALVIGVGQLRDGDVGVDPAGLNRAARGRVIARRGQPKRGLFTQLEDGLDRALAEAFFAHHDRAALILKCSGDDFGGGRAAGIDQNDDRQSVRHVARLGIEAFDIVLGPTAFGHDLALVEEGVTDRDRLVEQSARVGAEIDDIAQRLAAGGLVDAD